MAKDYAKEASLRRYMFQAQEAAEAADNAYQVELDRLGIERYTKAAQGDTDSLLSNLYDAKVTADNERHDAVTAMRAA